MYLHVLLLFYAYVYERRFHIPFLALLFSIFISSLTRYPYIPTTSRSGALDIGNIEQGV